MPSNTRSANPVDRWKGALLALCLLALGGCATTYRVDSSVQSFARWDAGSTTATAGGGRVPQGPQSFAFDRLPSQSVSPAAGGQDALESLARAALAQVGWTPVAPGAAAPWRVQVQATTLRLPYGPWDDPWGSPWGGIWPAGGGFAVGVGSRHIVWTSTFMRLDSPYYERRVALFIRRADTGEVVYETHAAHDGPWAGSPALWGAMLEAALRDFPAPPAGERLINIDVPR